MSIDGLKNVTSSGLKSCLLPFARWLETEKKVELPGSAEDIVDEWVGLTMDKIAKGVSTVVSMFQSAPDEAELPTTDEDDS